MAPDYNRQVIDAVVLPRRWTVPPLLRRRKSVDMDPDYIPNADYFGQTTVIPEPTVKVRSSLRLARPGGSLKEEITRRGLQHAAAVRKEKGKARAKERTMNPLIDEDPSQFVFQEGQDWPQMFEQPPNPEGAGPSGTTQWIEAQPPAVGASTSFDTLAMAANFVNDPNAAVQIIHQGGETHVIPVTDNSINTQEVIVRKTEESEVPDITVTAPAEEEEKDCIICSTDLSESARLAEASGNGGIGGSFAVWACDHLNCGALYCITCAVRWAGVAIQGRRKPACPLCTLPTDMKCLKKHATAFDDNFDFSELILRPPRRFDMRFWPWFQHFIGLHQDDPAPQGLFADFVSMFLAEGMPRELQLHRSMLAIQSDHLLRNWLLYYDDQISTGQIMRRLSSEQQKLLQDGHRYRVALHRREMDIPIIPPGQLRPLQTVSRNPAVPIPIQGILNTLYLSLPAVVPGQLLVRRYIVDSLQTLANAGPGTLDEISLNRLVNNIPGTIRTPAGKLVDQIRDAFDFAEEPTQYLVSYVVGPRPAIGVGNAFMVTSQIVDQLLQLPGFRSPISNDRLLGHMMLPRSPVARQNPAPVVVAAPPAQDAEVGAERAALVVHERGWEIVQRRHNIRLHHEDLQQRLRHVQQQQARQPAPAPGELLIPEPPVEPLLPDLPADEPPAPAPQNDGPRPRQRRRLAGPGGRQAAAPIVAAAIPPKVIELQGIVRELIIEEAAERAQPPNRHYQMLDLGGFTNLTHLEEAVRRLKVLCPASEQIRLAEGIMAMPRGRDAGDVVYPSSLSDRMAAQRFKQTRIKEALERIAREGPDAGPARPLR